MRSQFTAAGVCVAVDGCECAKERGRAAETETLFLPRFNTLHTQLALSACGFSTAPLKEHPRSLLFTAFPRQRWLSLC
jgi:hypothetical protein